MEQVGNYFCKSKIFLSKLHRDLRIFMTYGQTSTRNQNNSDLQVFSIVQADGPTGKWMASFSSFSSSSFVSP